MSKVKEFSLRTKVVQGCYLYTEKMPSDFYIYIYTYINYYKVSALLRLMN